MGGGCFGVVGDSGVVTVLLGGDVMLGRGVDQILPHPGTRHRLRMRYDAGFLDVESVSWPMNTLKLTISDPLAQESSVGDAGAR